ncbi:MAG: M18 family aminopeptidase [Marinilabiliaceae bacterium]|nr:M18 family aminopeptidase [Marinilabiliaceae bacterium]
MKNNNNSNILNLMQFINECTSPFQTINQVQNKLIINDFHFLDISQKWQLKKGGKYFTTLNQTSLFAFQIGLGDPENDGFKLISAHSDSPGFKIKPIPEMMIKNHYLKLNTEVYGSPILMSWMDRPLSIAGRIIIKSNDVLKPKHELINFQKPLLTIPNLAIHLNRQVNEGLNINNQIDMLPLLGIINNSLEKDNNILSIISHEFNVNRDSILDYDLYLYNAEKASLIGNKEEFISAPRLDNLAMVHAGLTALINAPLSKATNCLCIFDNEEVGSMSKQGAGSPILKHIIERILICLEKNREEFQRSIYKSFMISADMAHALHPNYTEKHDPVNQPLINGGPVIKYHSGQKYTTDGDSGAIFTQLCNLANVPYQKFVNRSDIAGGSTLGNISTTQINFKTVDVGNPMLAMHSARELAGTYDHNYIIQVFKQYYDI